MKIDIDKLTEAELVDLNHRIVERLRFLNQARAHIQMLEFKIGDRVTFQPEGRVPVEGMLTRYNKRTVTIITDDGRQWNVSVLSGIAPVSIAVTLSGEVSQAAARTASTVAALQS